MKNNGANWAAYDTKNQAVNDFINKQRSIATTGEEYGTYGSSKFTRVRGNYKSWLKSHGLKEADITGKDDAKAKKEEAAKALANKSWGLEDYKTHLNKLDRGEVTPDEHREAYRKFLENKDAIRAELGKMKKDDIDSWHHEDGYMSFSSQRGGSKDSVIAAKMRSFESYFDMSENANQWSHGEDLKEKTRRAVEGTSEEHLRAHSDNWKKRNEEQAVKDKQRQESLENPQTAHDWKRKRELAGGYLNLTPEEQAKHDDAYAAHRRERAPFKAKQEAEIKQLSGEGKSLDFTLSKNFHSKRGHDIFTASPGARVDKDSYREMEAAAKKLGGWYYKAFGGTPGGFHFKSEDDRNRFLELQKGSVDNSSAVASNAAEKQESQASRLQELAESQRERAEAKLNAPRKDNTARRARMAAGVESDARKDLAMSQTIEKIAAHIADGKAVHLQHVKNRSQVSTLDSMLRISKWNAIRHAEKHDANYKNLSYDQRESRADAPPTDHDIAHAEYPYPYLHQSEALSHAETLSKVPGLKSFAASLKRMAKEIGTNGKDYGQITDRGDIEKIKEALPKMRNSRAPGVQHIASRFAEKLEQMKRLEGMDVTNSHELKAALREYNSLKQQPAGADPIKAAERKLKRQKIEGFFPTPKSLIERMLDHADIEDGHDVLEPSAGIGSIMDAVKERHPGARQHGIEKDFDVAELLELKGHSYDRGDFMEHSKSYDRIVMNPPFENRQDEKHVKHAYGLLKPGGKMVAIMGAGAHTNERSAGFRDWLSTVGGKVYDTPEGSFNTDEAFRKTGVNTKMVVIAKPADGDEPSKYSNCFEPILLDSYPMIVDDDQELRLPPNRYDWSEAKHPREPAGTAVGGQFTAGESQKQSGAASPSNNHPAPGMHGRSIGEKSGKQSSRQRQLPERPDTQRWHSLHFKNQPIETQITLGDWRRTMNGLLAQAARVTGSYDQDVLWEAIDKDRLQNLLDEMNRYNRDSIAKGGTRIDDLANYNDVIPFTIAERLAGGSRFFDPSSLRGRWNEPQPSESSPASESTAESEDKPDLDNAPSVEKAPRITEDQFRRAFNAKPPAGVSKAKMKKVESRIRSMIGDNDEIVQAFQPLVVEAWQQLKREADDHNHAIREMTSATARTLGDTQNAAGQTTGARTIQSLSAMVRKARNGDLDPAKKRGFDELVDKFERNYPHMLQGRGEDGLLDVLAQGIKSVPDILDEEVANRAVTLAGPEFFAAMDQGESPHEEDFNPHEFEQVPFAWIAAAGQVAVWRYCNRSKVERYDCPSDAQREAGNYKMKHVRKFGFDISIETSKGKKRRPQWPAMPCDYGYIKDTMGKDGDHIDVFVGPNSDSDLVVVVDQVSVDGSFDEHKILLGFPNELEATTTYLKAYTNDWILGPVTTMTLKQFKEWLKSGKQSKMVSRQVSKYASMFEPTLINKNLSSCS